MDVVGVLPDAFFSGYGNETGPHFVFLSQLQEPSPPGETTSTYATRHARRDRTGHRPRAEGRRSRVPIVYLRTLDSELDTNTWPIRFISRLLVLFAVGSL